MYKKLFLVILLVSFFGYGQQPYEMSDNNQMPIEPKIIKYTRTDFNADPQFWTMCENNDGTLIFGNNDGALVFDGEHWQKIFLPNNSSVRSLTKTKNGTIYAGGYNELGTLQRNNFGNYFFKSLISEFHLEDKNIENLWQVHSINNLVIYRAFSEIIVINGNRITQLPANKSFVYAEKVNENYFVQDANFGIYKLDINTLSLSLVFDAKVYLNEEMASILPNQNNNNITLISKSGIVYDGNLNTHSMSRKFNMFENSKQDQVTFGIVEANNNFLIGTRSSRIIKCTKNGEIVNDNTLYKGLSNATIHFIYKTINNNIWVLQNNGLNFLDFKSPFVTIFDQASVYDILVAKNRVYLATNNGVYYSPFLTKESFNFKKIENLQGQCWAIQELDNDIMISHDTGIYKLENETIQKIGQENGFWKITKINNKQGWYLASNYNGLYLIQKQQQSWRIINKIKGFEESTRDIIADSQKNTYWICHGYKGVYKIHIDPNYSRIESVDHFTNKNGFQSAYNINVFKWNNKIVFTTNTGIYAYNNATNRFEKYSPLNTIFNQKQNTRKLLQKNNRTWFIQDDEVGYFDTNTSKPFLNKDLFLNLKGTFNRGMESMYPLDNNRILFGTNSGLYLYNINDNSIKQKIPTIINQVSYFNNQKTELIKINSSEKNINLPNQIDILRIEFSCPKMISSAEVNYSYKLENVDENWSNWQRIPYKEYTHLRPGSYTFIVKSRNLAGLIGEETSFQFAILPKWYQTNLAYFLYFISGILLIYFTLVYFRKRIAYERLKSKIEIKKTQQLMELEIERLKLKQDKEEIYKDKLSLEENIIDKSKELANYTLLLSQKKNAFLELQNDLKLLRQLLKSEDSRKKITEIFQKLNQQKIGEEYMDIFDVNFEKINHKFFEKLKKLDPTLTKRELRLCAFIKMDLTNKEIAPLLNISIRGVETARYKVRKKLNISHEENFASFLENRAI